MEEKQNETQNGSNDRTATIVELMFKGALYKNFKFAQNVTLERRLAQKLGVHVQGISSLAVGAI